MAKKLQSLTMDELLSLLAAVKKPRNRLLMKVGYHHGLRVSELTEMRKEDIQHGKVAIQRLKGSMFTDQPFQEDDDPLLDESRELRELALSLQPGEKVFPITRWGVDKFIKRAAAHTSVPYYKRHVHVLKHTIARHSIQDMGIEYVRQWLGHVNINSTGAYLQVTDEEAAAAMAKAKRAMSARYHAAQPSV